jgi:hypothetical protein
MFVTTFASCDRSEPTFVTSFVTIRWFSVAAAVCTPDDARAIGFPRLASMAVADACPQ